MTDHGHNPSKGTSKALVRVARAWAPRGLAPEETAKQ